MEIIKENKLITAIIVGVLFVIVLIYKVIESTLIKQSSSDEIKQKVQETYVMFYDKSIDKEETCKHLSNQTGYYEDDVFKTPKYFCEERKQEYIDSDDEYVFSFEVSEYKDDQRTVGQRRQARQNISMKNYVYLITGTTSIDGEEKVFEFTMMIENSLFHKPRLTFSDQDCYPFE